MGRALLITLAGILVALSYTFIGMNNRGMSMTRGNVNSYKAIKAKNMANSGMQAAINEYNDDSSNDKGDHTQEFNYSKTIDGTNLSLTVKESIEDIDGDGTANEEVVTIISESNYNGAKHEVVSTFDISQNQALVPEFVGALTIANGNFTLDTGNNKVHFDGHDKTGTCSDKPGFTVPTNGGVNQVGNDSGIDGNPPNVAVKDNSIDFDEVGDLIKALEPRATHVSGNYKGDLGTASEPGVFFVDSYTKLTGGIGAGHGILVIRSGGELDLEGELSVAGNFEFNGLVVFENAYKFLGRGTPDINGTIITGTSDSNTTLQIDVNGEINVQYDCQAKKYADNAVNNLLNTTLYQQLSVYE